MDAKRNQGQNEQRREEECTSRTDDDPGPVADYHPQSVSLTDPTVYPDMDLGATGTYAYGPPLTGADGTKSSGELLRATRKRYYRAVSNTTGVNISDVVSPTHVQVHLSGKGTLRGTAIFRIKETAPSCSFVIELEDSSGVYTKKSDPITVDAT
jgi:hypothetical protein